MRVLIVEDEALAREKLIRMLKKVEPRVEVVAELDSVSDTVSFIDQGNSFDVIFMDIQLADGSCFEIFKKIEISKPVIFTTAYDQYSLEAFKVMSIDYLLKPIDEEDLRNALNKLDLLALHSAGNISISQFLTRQKTRGYKKRFLVKSGNSFYNVPVEEIAYFFAEDKFVYLALRKSNLKYLVDSTLEELERSMVDPDQFFRISRKVIINIEEIGKVNRYNGTRLQLGLLTNPETTFQVSRDKVNQFKTWIDQ